MKKLLAVLTCMAVVLSMTACAENKETPLTNSSSSSSSSAGAPASTASSSAAIPSSASSSTSSESKPEQSSSSPEQSSSAPEQSSAKPQSSSTKPQSSSAKPQSSSAKPQSSSAKPQSSSAKPQSSSSKPQSVTPQSSKPQSSKPAPTTGRAKNLLNTAKAYTEEWAMLTPVTDQDMIDILLPGLKLDMLEDFAYEMDMVGIYLHEIFVAKPKAGNEAVVKEAVEARFGQFKGHSFYGMGTETAAGTACGVTDDGYYCLVLHRMGKDILAAMGASAYTPQSSKPQSSSSSSSVSSKPWTEK